MLIENENWDISSGNCGHQGMLHPHVHSTESVGPCEAGICLIILSGFVGPGSCEALPRGRERVRITPGVPVSLNAHGWEKKGP